MALLARSLSWSPDGVSRREVRLSLLPEFDRQTQSFAATPQPESLQNSRVFGGIERRVRLDPPERGDVSRLADFSHKFQRSTGQRPHVIAFVNSRSGGQTGRLLMETLSEHIGPPPRAFGGRVCDLSRGEEPADTISDMARHHLAASPRLLVCGGDGTVTWILTELENCPDLQGRTVPVAILPLGTGNDLARSLGWGGRLRRRRDLLQYLQWVARGTPVPLDQWELVLRPHEPLPHEHKLRAELGSHPRPVSDAETKAQLLADLEEALPSDGSLCREVYVGFWQNYYEIGAGAKVVTYVDTMRNNTAVGQCLFRAGLGKLAYARNICRALCQRRVTDYIESVQVADSPGAELRPLSPPLQERPVNGSLGSAREVVFANINSMVAGLAGNFLPADASPADGEVELLLWRNAFAALGTALGCTRPAHPASAGEAALRLSAGQFMEVDGEPWEMPSGCDILVRHHRRVQMLRAPLEAPFWRGRVRAGFWAPEADEGRPLLG